MPHTISNNDDEQLNNPTNATPEQLYGGKTTEGMPVFSNNPNFVSALSPDVNEIYDPYFNSSNGGGMMHPLPAQGYPYHHYQPYHGAYNTNSSVPQAHPYFYEDYAAKQ